LDTKLNNLTKLRGNYKSRITRRIVLQYLLALSAFIIGFLLLIFLGYQLTHIVTWQATDPLYQFLKFIKTNIYVVTGILIFIGWAFITYYFIGRPLKYLDEIIFASERLANPTEEQIILSYALKSVQDEFNTVRETALNNAHLAKEAEQRKNDLIVYLAHDLKTPLTSVIGYLTLLRDEGQISTELREKYLSISLEKAERLEDLINEFFEITRFNLSHIELQYSRVNLTRLLEQLTFEFKPMLLDKDLSCNLEISPDVMIKCDADKLQRVFDNLLRNAVFYSYEKSVIRISVVQNSTETVIRFINYGDNIPKEKLDRVFEQFYRLDAARSTNNGGAGLGLAIAKEITALHHGTITATSEHETIEFCVTLPLL
jgi:two-component system sensor histidine kinase VanS